MDDSLDDLPGRSADGVREECVVTPYPDGPLILRGDFRITGTDGQEINPGRQTVALCRCGRSALKPFCDGSHRRGFRASGGDERPRQTGRRVPSDQADRRRLRDPDSEAPAD